MMLEFIGCENIYSEENTAAIDPLYKFLIFNFAHKAPHEQRSLHHLKRQDHTT